MIQRNTYDEDDDTFRIEKEDIEMFKGKGLWFYDDNGNLVQATLNKTLLSNFQTDLKINLEDIVFFKLYTRNFTKGYQSLYLNDDFTFSKSNFDPKKPTKFITHGWINSYKSPACTLIRDGEIFYKCLFILCKISEQIKRISFHTKNYLLSDNNFLINL